LTREIYLSFTLVLTVSVARGENALKISLNLWSPYKTDLGHPFPTALAVKSCGIQRMSCFMNSDIDIKICRMAGINKRGKPQNGGLYGDCGRGFSGIE